MATNAQTYAAAQLVRVAAHALREAMGELARAQTDWTDEDYERYNKRVRLMNPGGLDEFASELEHEATDA